MSRPKKQIDELVEDEARKRINLEMLEARRAFYKAARLAAEEEADWLTEAYFDLEDPSEDALILYSRRLRDLRNCWIQSLEQERGLDFKLLPEGQRPAFPDYPGDILIEEARNHG